MAEPKPNSEDFDIFKDVKSLTPEEEKLAEDYVKLQMRVENTPIPGKSATPAADMLERQRRQKLPLGYTYADLPPQEGEEGYELVYWDTITQTVQQDPYFSPLEERKIEDYRTSPEEKYSIYDAAIMEGTVKQEAMDAVDPSLFDKAKDLGATALGAVYEVAQPLEVPRAMLWKGASFGAQILPNPDSYLGDMAGTAFSKLYPGMSSYAELLSTPARAVWARDFDSEQTRKELDLGIAGKEPEETDVEAFEEELESIGKEIYKRLATGEVYEKFTETDSKGSLKHKFDHTVFAHSLDAAGIEIGMYRGRDLIDGLITKEESIKLAELALKAGDENAYKTYTLLSDDTNREWFGLAIEAVLDPLNLVSGGTHQVIKVGGKSISISQDVAKAVNAVQETGKMSRPEASRIVIEAMDGNKSAIAKVNELRSTVGQEANAASELVAELTAKKSNPEAAIAAVQEDINKAKTAMSQAMEQARAQKASDLTPEMIAAKGGNQAKALSQMQADTANFISAVEKELVKKTRQAERMQDAGQASRYLQNEITKAGAVATNNRVFESALERVLDPAYELSKGVQTRGVINLNLPFRDNPLAIGTRQFNITPIAGDDIISISERVGVNTKDLAKLNGVTEDALDGMIKYGERITVGLGGGGLKGLVPDPIIRVGQKVSDPLQPVNLKKLVARAAKNDSTLTKGERLALIIGEGQGSLIRQWSKVSLFTWDFAAKLVGSRFYQPFIAARRTQEALEYYRNRGVSLSKLNQMFGSQELQLIRLQKAAPDIWNNYQDAYGNYIRSLSTGLEKSAANVVRLQDMANDIAAERKARGQIGQSGQEVLNEAANYMEMGRKFPTELKPLVESIQALHKKIVGDADPALKLDLEKVKQALANIARFVQGDLQRAKDISSNIKRLKNQIEVKKKELLKEADTQAELPMKALASEKATLDKLKSQVSRERKRLAVLQKLVDEGEQLTKRQKSQYDKLQKPKEINKRNELIEMHKQAAQRIKDRQAEIRQAITKYKKALKDDKTGVRIEERYLDNDPFVAALNRSLEGFDNALMNVTNKQKELAEVSPKIVADRIKVAKGESFSRALVKWEEQLYEGFEEITEGYTREQKLYALMATFKRSEPLTGDGYAGLVEKYTGTRELGAPKKLADKDGQPLYPTVIGERFRDVPEDIEPLVNKLSNMLESYGEAYKKNGMEFVKTPEDLMTIFGVVEHVPHLKYQKETFAIKQGDIRAEKIMTGETDEVISGDLAMDAGRYRSLIGTIQEINALTKTDKDAWHFAINPELLHARFMNGTKGLASKEIFLTFLRTGVIRQFDNIEQARQSGYVPVMGQRRYGKDMQVMMLGSQDELIAAGGKAADGTLYREMIEGLEESYKIESTLSTWASDLKQISNTLKVEKVVGTVRALQAEALKGRDPGLRDIVIKDGILDIRSMHKERAASNVTEYFSSKRAELDALLKKQQELKSKGKDLGKADKMDQEKLLKIIDDQSLEHEIIIKRLNNQTWKEISDDVNRLIADILNKAREIPRGSTVDDIVNMIPNVRAGLSPLTPTDLKMYFGDQAIPKMYIPEQIEESFRSLTAKTSGRLKFGTVMNIARKTNNFWKTRMTIPFVMFHTRNVVGNFMSNVLDVGTFGVFNIRTQMQAAKFATAVDYYAAFGSLEEAVKALSAPRKASESGAAGALAYTKRKAKALELNKLMRNEGQMIDFGDGIKRTMDEALELLTSKGVISGSASYRMDYDEMQEFMFDVASSMSKNEVKAAPNQRLLSAQHIKKAKKLFNITEDVVTVSASSLIAGFPIAMPKGMGEVVARRLENRSRMINFIANMKRGGNIDEAVKHVEKFLFNYNDLTPWQKDYMRVLVPFFTWTQKNVDLQIKMMQENPAFYANFVRLFYHTLPMVTQIEDKKAVGDETTVTFKGMMDGTANRVKYYKEYKMYRVRIGVNALRAMVPGALGVKPDPSAVGLEAEGLGLPIESFGEYVGAAQMMLTKKEVATDKNMFQPLFARTHWVAKALYVLATDRDPFYEEDLKTQKMRNANDIANLIYALCPTKELTLPDGTVEIVVDNIAMNSPNLLDDPYRVMRNHITEVFRVDTASDGKHFYVHDNQDPALFEPHNVMKYFPNTLSRTIREAALIQDIHLRGSLSREAYKVQLQPEEIPLVLRVLNATTGIKLKRNADISYLRGLHLQQLSEAIDGQASSIGLTKEAQKTIIKK